LVYLGNVEGDLPLTLQELPPTKPTVKRRCMGEWDSRDAEDGRRGGERVVDSGVTSLSFGKVKRKLWWLFWRKGRSWEREDERRMRRRSSGLSMGERFQSKGNSGK